MQTGCRQVERKRGFNTYYGEFKGRVQGKNSAAWGNKARTQIDQGSREKWRQAAPPDIQMRKGWETKEDTGKLKQRSNTMPSITCASQEQSLVRNLVSLKAFAPKTQ